MRTLFLIVIPATRGACQRVPDSQRWMQNGKLEQVVQEDDGHCEKVAMQEANGMRSTEVFKEEAMKERCMKRLGYVKHAFGH